MVETIEEMRVRHKQEIADLQDNCDHPKEYWSDWMEFHWAIGHSTGYHIRQCNLCGVEVARKPPKVVYEDPEKERE